ncbi:type II toxin-antitoxin system VapC family toxin [Allorhizobium sp. BGMRC 0089]|uniref:type II toxin-antitoxin system VapC family toxin n=1 Tax=Allorhizobium sonneratiae TaxID=2934936 RepID=UPI0020346466|nr:type II toxin-antitoxin system VapC family toxin [Allorhizobium sonneratiae]MCM2294791.1 type II toxin-antitoxin system VapC family toxin [Allorhizobium sonneratiae]
MFIDASVLVSILTVEDDAGYFIAKIESYKKPIYYSSLSLFEASESIARKMVNTGDRDRPTPPEMIDMAQRLVEDFIAEINARPMSIDASVYRSALAVAKQYGRYAGHPAALNLGDCFAYACAKSYRIPLLYKGNHFSESEIERP